MAPSKKIYKYLSLTLMLFFITLLSILLYPSKDKTGEIKINKQQVDSSYYSGGIIDYDLPTEMYPGQIYLASITYKNNGDLKWSAIDQTKLATHNDIINFNINNITIPFNKEIEKGSSHTFRFIIVARDKTKLYEEEFQLKNENIGWFGDSLKVKIYVKNQGPKAKIKLEKFDLIFSEKDIKHFGKIAEEAIANEALFTSTDRFEILNKYRNAKVVYKNKTYDVEVKIHGAFKNHYLKKNRSYKIKLKNGKKIKGFNEFSLIIFTDRIYSPLLVQYLAEKLDIKYLKHELVNLKVNDGQYINYFFRGAKNKDFLEKSGFSNTSFLSTKVQTNSYYNKFVKKSGGHLTSFDYEPSFNYTIGEPIDYKKVYNSLHALNKKIENFNTKSETNELLDFFDYTNLINSDVIKTIFNSPKDFAGDNTILAYRETSGKFMYLNTTEILSPYTSNLFEFESNRDYCQLTLKDQFHYGDTIYIFPELNKYDSYRQDKYRKIHEIIGDPNNMKNIVSLLQENHLAEIQHPIDDYELWFKDKPLIYSFAHLLGNIDFISNELSYSKLVILKDQNLNKINFNITPLSISEIGIQEFKLKFLNEFSTGSNINIEISFDDKKKYFNFKTTDENHTLDITDFIKEKISLGLDENLLPKIRHLSIEIKYDQNNSLDAAYIKAKNLVSKSELTNLDIILSDNKSEYLKNIEKYFKYKDDYNLCEGKNYPKLDNFDWSLINDRQRLEKVYKELWQVSENSSSDLLKYLEPESDLSKSISTLQNYPYKEKFNTNTLIDSIRYDLSLSKLFINAIEEKNTILLEILPVSISFINFVNFKISTDLTNGNYKISLKFKNPQGQEIINNQTRIDIIDGEIDISDIMENTDIYSDFDKNLRVKKTKYILEIEFLDVKDISMNGFHIEAINTTTGASLQEKDIKYQIIDSNKFYEEDIYLDPHQAASKNKVLLTDGKELFLKGTINVESDLIIPKNTKLIIEPGTKIQIDKGLSIVSYSPVIAKGTKESPISIKSKNISEPFGVFALANEGASGSTFEYINVENGSEDYINGIYFSGMFSAYHNSDNVIKNSSFKHAQADDALNFKYSNSKIVNSYFSDNSGDAIDFDYMSGEISDSYFESNGNDGIDLAGSKTIIKNNKITKSSDKCISLGEESSPIIFNNILDGCKTGIEIKDLSKPIILNNTIVNNEIGINSYQKKDFFGGGHGKVWNTLLYNNDKEITFEGKNAKTDDSDIKVFYSNIQGGYSGKGNMDKKIFNNDLSIDEKGNLEIIKKYFPDYFGKPKIGVLYNAKLWKLPL